MNKYIIGLMIFFRFIIFSLEGEERFFLLGVVEVGVSPSWVGLIIQVIIILEGRTSEAIIFLVEASLGRLS